MRRGCLRLASGLVAGLCLSWPASAETPFPEAFRNLLSNGQTLQAGALAEARLGVAPNDAQARFAFGAAQFLQAVEGLGQGLYRHGLVHGQVTSQWLPSVTDLPFLRLPVPINPTPEPFDAAAFRRILEQFDADLAEAGSTLAMVPPGPLSLPLDLGRVRLDLNGDGVGAEGESLNAIFVAVTALTPESPLPTVSFDESDVPWLRGYAHLLGGITDILLAHDLTETIEQTFQAAFPQSPLAAAQLNAQFGGARAELQAMYDAGACAEVPWELLYGDNDDLTDEEKARLAEYRRCQDLSAGFEYGGAADLVALIHLFRWPVVEPARLLSARQHFLDMISLSRENWALILAETDDEAEWVPSPKQTSLLPNMRVTDDIVAGWMDFLDQAEGVLEGRYLLAHWRFDQSRGLNLRRMFEDPRTLDPILLLTGSGAIPFIEEGPLAPAATLDTAMGLIDNGMLAYFLWFN